MSDDLRDPFDEAGPSGPPAISWKNTPDGTTFEGVVIPPLPMEAPDKGYVLTQERGNQEENRGKPLVWPPEESDSRVPITVAEYWAQAGTNAPNPQKVSRAEIYFTTEYDDLKFVSGRAKERLRDSGGTDDGKRRIIMSGADLREKITEALKKVGEQRPQNGQRWTVTLDHREVNRQTSYETNRFVVVIKPPTQDTTNMVKAYVAEQKKAAATGDLNDPWAAGPSSTSGDNDEPPF